jgi:Protein of unknown function (DUF3455)
MEYRRSPESHGASRFVRRAAQLVFGAITVVSLMSDAQAAGPAIVTPPVPFKLEVEAGNTAFLIGHALGTQNYVCLPSGAAVAWTLFGPQATLFDDSTNQQITHFLSVNPIENGTLRATWQHSGDTSRVWAAATASSSDPNYVAPGAIPWLLLEMVGTQYGPNLGHKMTETTFIQRVNTAGGIAPATGCTASTDIGKKVFVPYTADYIFYRP